MRIAADGDSVNVHYTGFLDDGTEFDSSRGGEPLNFVIGAGTVIRGFDDAVRGLRVGASRRSRIEAERAYGQRSDELIISISAASIPKEMKLKVGDRVPLSNGMRGCVVDVNEKEVRLDANHELAGKALTFDMQLVSFFEPVLQPVQEGLKRIIFGLGCFWGKFLRWLRAPLAVARVKGVISTKVGYTQGTLVNPSYEQVCSGTSGHVEAVAVDYDESVVSYEELLELFWERLGRWALTLNQVGNDVGCFAYSFLCFVALAFLFNCG
ncbi:peptide methionine sulfoxide reductase [Gracilaria domingensis]|nr:peptide methionine sulfoxide reductase [Gracilaria domingensis]